MPTETRPATESDHATPLPTAYLSAPRLPTRCGPVEAVPVSAASPKHVRRHQCATCGWDGAMRMYNGAVECPRCEPETEEPSEDDEPTPYVGSETWAENWIDHCERIGVKP